MAFNVGDTVGDYLIIGILGVGGMGKVYKARNVITDRVEALKVLLPDLANEADLAERFMREIKVLASLSHPNIAGLHTALRLENQLLMVMEFVEGRTIEDRIREGLVPPGEAAGYICQALSALGFAHEHGVVHRDIKPANMMVTQDGRLKLMDFGIAKAVADRRLTMTGTTLGSLFYMSPEQVKGTGDVDGRSDLYSVGVSLYEMVTGTRPFKGDSDYSIMVAHLEQLPIPPIQIDPTLPPALSEIILTAIQKDRENRFQSAQAFRAALESVATFVGQPVRPPMPAAASQPAAPVPPPLPGAPTVTHAMPQAWQPQAATLPPVPPPFPQAAPPPPPLPAMGGWSPSAATIPPLPPPMPLPQAAAPPPTATPWPAPPIPTPTAPTLPQAAAPPMTATPWPAPPTPPPQPVAWAQPPAAATASAQGSSRRGMWMALGAVVVLAVLLLAAGLYRTRAGSTGGQSVVPAETPQPSEPSPTPEATPAAEPATAVVPPSAPSEGAATVPARPSRPISHAARPEAVPPSMGAAQPAVPPQPPAPPAVDEARLEQLRDRLGTLGPRANAIRISLQNLERQQQASGFGMRGDISASWNRMEYLVDQAQAALNAGNAGRAQKHLDLAEQEAEKLDRFLGR